MTTSDDNSRAGMGRRRFLIAAGGGPWCRRRMRHLTLPMVTGLTIAIALACTSPAANPDAEDACWSLAETTARRGEECGQDYATVFEDFGNGVEAALGVGCEGVKYLREPALMPACFSAVEAMTCGQLAAGEPPSECRAQFRIVPNDGSVVLANAASLRCHPYRNLLDAEGCGGNEIALMLQNGTEEPLSIERAEFVVDGGPRFGAPTLCGEWSVAPGVESSLSFDVFYGERPGNNGYFISCGSDLIRRLDDSIDRLEALVDVEVVLSGRFADGSPWVASATVEI